LPVNPMGSGSGVRLSFLLRLIRLTETKAHWLAGQKTAFQLFSGFSLTAH
jgi:hypothetical protein